MKLEGNFPVLYGPRITNTREFTNAMTAAWADLLAGRISVKEANAVNRESREILKTIKAVIRLRKLRAAS